MRSLSPHQRQALSQSLHSLFGAGFRWDQRRASGLDHAGLREAVAFEMGEYTQSSSGWTARGREPGIWFHRAPLGPADLHGNDLLRHARELLRIPEPGAIQGRLPL